MSPAQIELWAIDAIKRAQNKGQNEDSFIELKREWPLPDNIARQLAAHANAARGNDILWIIGVNNDGSVIGSAGKELAAYFAQIQSHFDGHMPIPTEIGTIVEGKNITCVRFQTNEAPYVLKLPSGFPGGIDREVPWREGTRTMTAQREHLIQILVPISKAPSIAVLESSMYGRDKDSILYVHIYVVPADAHRVTMRFSDVVFRVENQSTGQITDVYPDELHPRTDDKLAIASKEQVTIEGPCNVSFTAKFGSIGSDREDAYKVHASFRTVQTPSAVLEFILEFPTSRMIDKRQREWKLSR